ncbi:MAG: SOS response-associated peptidase [Ignavibacteriae bacterium]|nr:MAG: SOS response-associated peptidase [Ignavibacteriota bacterium]
MCGRYAFINGKMVFELVGRNLGNRKDALDDLPRYNAAPMQRMPVIVRRDGELLLQKMQWWLIPHWSSDGKVKATTFNAKSETLDQSKLFTPYFKSSRCLVPADAFYEWKKTTVQREVKGKTVEVHEKQPMCIRMKNNKTFLFAGLFSVWKNEKGEEFPSFTIVTTTPNTLMAEIHTRMPVILQERHYDEWLDRENKNTEDLKKLLLPYPAAQMEAFPVSSYVSDSRHEGPECMEKNETK